MKTYWHEQSYMYNGTQLSSLFAYRTFSVQGDSVVGFRGKCHVTIDEMVDLADVKEQAHIYSTDMVHFIIERFVLDLEKAVYAQRLFVTIVKEVLESQIDQVIVRSGDDLYIDDKKLSVSIATLSPVSSMIHFGINVSSYDTPLPTLGLDDLDIDPREFAFEVMRRYVSECESMYMARCKVRGVL